jgi:hypothetical protein
MPQQKPPRKVIGSFEQVLFPDFGNYKVMAKIDTGAYTGALHCTKIHEEETEKGKVLHFSPFDHPEVIMTVTDFAVRHVRSSNGERTRRYFIDTNITLHGQTYPIVLSLADRSEMKWPVLIGRRFLRKNRFLVDVNKVNS